MAFTYRFPGVKKQSICSPLAVFCFAFGVESLGLLTTIWSQAKCLPCQLIIAVTAQPPGGCLHPLRTSLSVPGWVFRVTYNQRCCLLFSIASNFHIFVSFCTCSVAKKELDDLERWKEERRPGPIKLVPQRLGKTHKSAIMNCKILFSRTQDIFHCFSHATY